MARERGFKSWNIFDSALMAPSTGVGAPVLVSAGTWMGDKARSLGNGLVIEELSPQGIVDCIVRAQAGLPPLRAAAARVAKDMRERHGAGRCIDAIADAFAGTGET